MRKSKEIMKKSIVGCLPIAVGMFLAMLFCLIISLVGCKPSERIVEVEMWRHDTTTVVDTLRITDTKILHDSVYITEYAKQFVKDSTQANVACKYYTYDSTGNITSLTDYTSSTQHGSVAHTATEGKKTSVSGQESAHNETSGHGESKGHSSVDKGKEKVKTGLTKWQRFVMGMGYVFIVVLALGAMFGGMRLYGKIKKR